MNEDGKGKGDLLLLLHIEAGRWLHGALEVRLQRVEAVYDHLGAGHAVGEM